MLAYDVPAMDEVVRIVESTMSLLFWTTELAQRRQCIAAITTLLKVNF
jgi:hypothetical protein